LFCEFPGRHAQGVLDKSPNHPPAAKAGPLDRKLAARLKPCPFKTARELSFSAVHEAVPFQNRPQIEYFRSL
jgi:hypothetical protein